MKFDIVCFGSCLVDIFAYTNAHEFHGEVCYPLGSKIEIENIGTSIGGGGMNTSTTFSKMNLKTGLIGSVGDDDFGKEILNIIKKRKISFLGQKNGETGYSIILDSIEHNRTLLTYKGTNNLLTLKDIKNFENINTKWVYFSSLTGKAYKTQVEIAKKFKNKGVKIVFNPSLYLLKKEKALDLIRNTDVLILNKEEALLLNQGKKLNKLLDFGLEIVCVTDAKKPFYCYTKEKTYKVFPHKKIKISERTGAGDAFASGFIAAYIKTRDIELALQVGVTNSESVIKFPGSTNKILNWNEALKTVKENPCKIKILYH